jgi:phosphoribosylformylglycinamidine synthase subunit PurL
MNLSNEDLRNIEELLGREPTEVEKYIFDTMWSEHCSYKSSKDVLKKYLPTKGSEVALSIGEDAGIVYFAKHNNKQYCVAVAHESHNHPSQILPIEGAATGVGGVVRDVYCMGADVVGVMNSIHFGIDEKEDNPLVDEIAEEVVVGISDYANPLGVPVLGGETIYHPSYNDNCLVNVAALGILEEKDLLHSYVPKEAKDEPYDVILIGKSTDATGFGGASFSSTTLDNEDKQSNVGAVQVHDPFLKRVIAEAIKFLFKELKANNIKAGFKDLGAGGISCATSEIAAASGFGVEVHLDKVNLAFADLRPEVIACSETQERFCLAVPVGFTQRVLDIFNKEFELPELYQNAGAVVIGRVVQEPVFTLFYENECVCNLPVQAITKEVKVTRHAKRRVIQKVEGLEPKVSGEELENLLTGLIKLENNCSKRYVYRFFDNAVRGDTIVYPGEADAVVVSPVQGCNAGLVTTIDSNLYGFVDPYVCGVAAVAEAVRNLICVGGRPLTVTDCLNYGNPEKPEVFYDFTEGVKGIADACNALSFIDDEPIPIVSGNVSFYNESKQGSAVVPSPVIVAVGKMEDYHKALTMQVKKPGMNIILIGQRFAEYGGTQVNNIYQGLNNVAPQVRLDFEAKNNKVVHALINQRLLAACHDISMGGFWVSILEMLLGERGLFQTGASLNIPKEIEPFKFLFSENSGYIIALDDTNLETVKAMLDEAGVWYSLIGKTQDTGKLEINKGDNLVVDFKLNELEQIWNSKNK